VRSKPYAVDTWHAFFHSRNILAAELEIGMETVIMLIGSIAAFAALVISWIVLPSKQSN